MARSSHLCASVHVPAGILRSRCCASWLSQSAARIHWRLCCSARRSGLSGACTGATVAWRKDGEDWNKGGKRIGQRRSSLHIGRQAERRKSASWKSRHRRIEEDTGGERVEGTASTQQGAIFTMATIAGPFPCCCINAAHTFRSLQLPTCVWTSGAHTKTDSDAETVPLYFRPLTSVTQPKQLHMNLQTLTSACLKSSQWFPPKEELYSFQQTLPNPKEISRFRGPFYGHGSTSGKGNISIWTG